MDLEDDLGVAGRVSGWMVIGSITLAAVPESVAEAREFASGVLGDGERADTAELLISEACTNSVVHSESRFGGKFTLTLFAAGGVLRCEVVDEGGPTVPTRRDGAELRDSGYGVMLIETLADRAGYFTECGRLHTWFEFGQGVSR
ncbi:ATP-binding protein [Actinomadura vinacea]|uniref:ATP-binding protein n=1 Tax=Actinomadura vinacea TaxID=115336 RepID=UPI0031D4B633